MLFCVTMDAERIRAESPPGGPPDWDFSERAIAGFSRTIEAEDACGTFFIVPETAHRHRDLWLGLDPARFELGLHLHPQSLGDGRWSEYLGAYRAAEQRRLIETAAASWEQALGRRPRAFRPGNYSANDDTFRLLAEARFTHGSVSAPGRVAPDFRAVWAGALPWPHRAHAHFRLIAGDLDFMEAPVAQDPAEMREPTPLRFFPRELRVEWGDAEVHGRTIRRTLRRMLDGGAAVLAVVAMTHNTEDYFTEGSPRLDALRGLIRHARLAAEEHALEFTAATIEDVRAALLSDEGRREA
jgi:hypothetical protein